MTDREESVGEKRKKLEQDFGGRTGEFGRRGRDNSSGRDGGRDGGRYGDRDGGGRGSARYRDNDYDEFDRHNSGCDGGRHSRNGVFGYRDSGRDNDSCVAYNCRPEQTQKITSDNEGSGKHSGGGDSVDRDANDRLIPEFIVRDNKNNA